MVYRVYVEKKRELASEAKALLNDVRNRPMQVVCTSRNGSLRGLCCGTDEAPVRWLSMSTGMSVSEIHLWCRDSRARGVI